MHIISIFLYLQEKMKGKNKLVPRLLGINKESVVRVDERTKEVIKYLYSFFPNFTKALNNYSTANMIFAASNISACLMLLSFFLKNATHWPWQDLNHII